MPEVGGGLLAVLAEEAPGQLEEMERWYEDDHLYERSAIEGFLYSRRYISVQGEPRSLTLYEITGPEVLHGDGYAKAWERENAIAAARAAAGNPIVRRMANMVRNEYELITSVGSHPGEIGAFIWMVREDIPEASDATLTRWYEEHLPLVTAMGTVRGVRRYHATMGTPRYLTVYDLATAEAIESDAWKRSFETPLAAVLTQRTDVTTNLGQFFKIVTHDEALCEMATWPPPPSEHRGDSAMAPR